MTHKANRILKVIDANALVEFDQGEQRWVDLKPLTKSHPVLKGYRITEESLSIINGGMLIAKGKVTITGPTLYHMGKIEL